MVVGDLSESSAKPCFCESVLFEPNEIGIGFEMGVREFAQLLVD